MITETSKKLDLHVSKISSIPTRDKILEYFLVNRSGTKEGHPIREIAQAFNLSRTSTRNYLILLEKMGLIIRTEQKQKTGRPIMLYTLHENAIEVFPKIYNDFALNLLKAFKKKYGNGETDLLLKQVGRKMANQILDVTKGELEHTPPFLKSNQKLKKIFNYFEKNGSFPEMTEEDTFYVLKNYNCLMYRIAKPEPLVCKVGEALISELAESKVVKEKCIREGDPYCSFRIQKNIGK